MHSRLRRRVGVIVLLLLASTLLAAGTARADTVTFGAAVPAPGGVELKAITCPSATSCDAVGTDYDATSSQTLGVVVPIVNGVPGAPVTIPPPTATTRPYSLNPTSISCPSATVCVVAGSYGAPSNMTGSGAFVSTVTGGAPAAAQVSTAADVWNGISCWAVGSCLAAGAGASNNVLYAAHALVTGGVPATVSDDAAESAEYTGVECYGTSTCEALGADPGGNTAVLVPINGGATGASVAFDADELPFGFGCEGANCVAVGGGDFRTVDAGTVGPDTMNSGDDVAAACPTTTNCLLAGNSAASPVAQIDTVDGGTPGASFTDPSVTTFNAIACGSATSCLALSEGSAAALVPVTFAASPAATGASPGTGAGGTSGGGTGGSAAPAPAATATFGRATQRRGIAAVPVSCAGASCTVTLTETIRERVRHGHHTKTETVTIATRTTTLAAGVHATETVALNRAGRAALDAAKGRKLSVTLTVTLAGHAPTHHAITLTASAPRRHPKKRK